MKIIKKVNISSGLLSAVCAFFLLLLSIACSKSEDYITPRSKGVDIKINSIFGKILTDDLGNSLYFFSNDAGITSSCVGGCIDAWPVFYVSNPIINPDLESNDFAEITRPDGSKQTTYKGWPLYYFAGDVNAGDVTGDKSGGIWYVAKPDYSVMVANNPSANVKYLVAPKGKTLYTFANDTQDVSTCIGNCLTNWPAFVNHNEEVPSILSTNSLGIITRTGEGTQQSTYHGKPLYYYSQDIVRGDTLGQGLGNGAWLKINETNF